jgi:hypothetical protein
LKAALALWFKAFNEAVALPKFNGMAINGDVATGSSDLTGLVPAQHQRLDRQQQSLDSQ